MLQIKSDKFQVEVLESKVPVLVDFSATWCGPCQQMGPVLNQLSAELEGKAKVFKVDIDESMELAQKYQVMSVPNMIFFKDGKPVDAVVGITAPAVLKSKLEGLL
ncbi:thioredoxin [Chakrabartyella piscis]|uniref:thioredoxin n=1 Tax=Chakrabartyella piscis TaxID=2918914 RepID=UPI002958AF9F|nr:thioredoxin [Chakrabartyella piscis]